MFTKANSTFDVERLPTEDQEWYNECLDTLHNHKIDLNSTEQSSLSEHFKQPTESLCVELLAFTKNPVSIFGPEWQNSMIITYS